MGVFDADIAEANPVQGYLSYARIAGTYVHPTGGTLNSTHNPVIQEFYENGLWPGKAVMSPGLHAHGTEVDGGEIDFEIPVGQGAVFMKLLSDAYRGGNFGVQAGTSSKGFSLGPCWVESFTLASSSGQLVNGNLAFKSTKAWANATPGSPPGALTPIPYHITGAPNVVRWSVNCSYPLKPVYPNADRGERPRYLRVGKTRTSISVTTVGGLVKNSVIAVGSGNIEICGVLTEQGIRLATRGNINEYTYTVRGVGPYTSPPPNGTGGPLVPIMF